MFSPGASPCHSWASAQSPAGWGPGPCEAWSQGCRDLGWVHGGTRSRAQMYLCVPRNSCHLWLLPGSCGGLLGPARPLLQPCAVPGGPSPVKATAVQRLWPVLGAEPRAAGTAVDWTTIGHQSALFIPSGHPLTPLNAFPRVGLGVGLCGQTLAGAKAFSPRPFRPFPPPVGARGCPWALTV